jgi:hypothetical protein
MTYTFLPFEGRYLKLPCLLLLSVAAWLSGCGRHATESDCALLIDRSVELQMKELRIGDPEAIVKRQEQLRRELQGEMKDCVGRRVTDTMMACVRRASSPAELEGCIH